jgi:VWFA-related protein
MRWFFIAALAGLTLQSGPRTSPPALRLDAVVTDPQGGAVTGLRASDFEVLEDGIVRPLQAAEFRWVPRRSTVDVLPIQTRADEERAARQPGTRVFAIFLDEFHVSAGASDLVRDAVGSFLDDKMYERDLAAVIAPLDPVQAVSFTRDRSVLHGSLAAFAGRQGVYRPRTTLEEQRVGRDPVAAAAARDRIVKTSLSDLGARLAVLGADRVVIVIVSEGLARDALENLLRASSRFHAPVYTFNPADPDEQSRFGVDREHHDAALQEIAAETGGLHFSGVGQIAGFARVFHDTHGFYALTYEPAHADGQVHRLEVRARAGAVRAARSYWAATGTEPAAVFSSSSEERVPRVLRQSALIDAWIGLRRQSDGGARLIVTWEPGAGRSPAHHVAIAARTDGGRPLFSGVTAPVGDTVQRQDDGARFDVPPGRVEIDLSVFDQEGRLLDTDARRFDVPDPRLPDRPGPALPPVEIVRARSPREFDEAVRNPLATPASSRTFDRASRLLVRAAGYDSAGTAVQVSARVLNRAGQPMRPIDPIPGALPEGVVQFSLPLSWLAPGPYQLEVSGENVNGRTAQRLAFEVK